MRGFIFDRFFVCFCFGSFFFFFDREYRLFFCRVGFREGVRMVGFFVFSWVFYFLGGFMNFCWYSGFEEERAGWWW